MVDVRGAKNSQNTADNLIGTVDSKPILKKGEETVKTIVGPVVVNEDTLSGPDGFVVGHPDYE